MLILKLKHRGEVNMQIRDQFSVRGAWMSFSKPGLQIQVCTVGNISSWYTLENKYDKSICLISINVELLIVIYCMYLT